MVRVEQPDTATRILANKAEEFLGRPIAVLNKAGGAGFVPVPFNSGSEREVAMLGGNVALSFVGPASANVRCGPVIFA